MSGLSKTKLVYDPTDSTDSDNVGVFLKDGSGTALTSTLVGSSQALDVNVVQNAPVADQNASGSLTALNTTTALSIYGVSDFIFELSGTWVGTVVAEASDTAGNVWNNLGIFVSGVLTTAGVSANGVYKVVGAGGYNQVRLRMSAYTSGTADTYLNLSPTSSTSFVHQTNPQDLKVTAYTNDGSGNGIGSTEISSTYYLDTFNLSIHQDGSTYTAGSDYGAYVLGVNSSTGDYAPLSINSDGALKVDATLVPTFAHAENSSHTVGDEGSFSLAYRQDTLVTDISASGDYAGLKSNNRGALWTAPVGTVADGVTDTENPVKVGSVALAGPLSAIGASGDRANLISDMYRRVWVNKSSDIGGKNTAVSVTTTAAALLGSSLAGRETIIIQNNGSRPIYIGWDNTVTASNGIKIDASANINLDIGPDVAVWAISGSGTQAAIVTEIA